MFWPHLILNVLALACLFTNNRLTAILCFFAFSAFNIVFLFQAAPTIIDPVFFTISILSALAVYAALSAHSRDQVLTHQKKRASFHLLIWSVVIAFFFGRWLLALQDGKQSPVLGSQVELANSGAEAFMLVAIVVLWLVGRRLYDKP